MLFKQGDRKERFRRRMRKNKVERGNEIGEECKKMKWLGGKGNEDVMSFREYNRMQKKNLEKEYSNRF